MVTAQAEDASYFFAFFRNHHFRDRFVSRPRFIQNVAHSHAQKETAVNHVDPCSDPA